MKAKITKRAVDAAEPSDRDVFIWDTETRGFGLKVTPAGRRVYLVQGRVRGRIVRYTIGEHGSPWTPDKAREKALTVLGEMASGKNPNAAKKKDREGITVSELADIYVKEGCARKKASTLAVESGLIERHIKPLLGARRVDELHRGDLERFAGMVANGRTATNEKTAKKRGRAVVRGGKGTANRTMDLLSSMLTFAVHRNVRPDNPARGVRKFSTTPRERFLSLDEIARLGEAMAQLETEHAAAQERAQAGGKLKSGRKGQGDPESGANPFALAAIRLLLLTGCRRGEILSLRWEHVDFERGCLRLPDSKTGARVVPIGAAALAVLEGLPRFEANPHVFPGARGTGHLTNINKVWRKVRERAGIGDCRLHDLRHSYASVGVAGGDSLYVVGKVLGHAKARTTERYAHLADDPVKAAAEKISGQIAAALDRKGGTVVPFPEGAKGGSSK